jgi:hypothetical protein
MWGARAMGFDIIIIEIPNEVTLQYVNELRLKALKLDYETADSIFKSSGIELEEDEADIDIEEADLFHLGREELKVRRNVISTLLRAIDAVIAPRVGCRKRFGSNPENEYLSYFDLDGKTYVAAGGHKSSYYSKSINAYNYIKILNVSSVMEELGEIENAEKD